MRMFEKRQLGSPDPIALLFEANDARRALEHARCNVQRAVDPMRESQHLADAWRTLADLARKAFPNHE